MSALALLFALAFAPPAAATDAWTQLGERFEGTSFNEFLGAAVSLSGDGSTLGVTSLFNSAAGEVDVNTWNGSSWVAKGSTITSGEQNFGFSISLSDDGNTIAIGSPTEAGGGTQRGVVEVWAWNGTTWTQRGSDIPGALDNQWLGYSVSLSADGNTVAIGAPGNTSPAVQGLVKVASWTGSTWARVGVDLQAPAGGSTSDRFGLSVSLSNSGDSLAIAAPGLGTTWAYELSGGSWATRGSGVALTGGRSVALSGDSSVLGVRSETQAQVLEWTGGGWSQRGSTFALPGPESSNPGIALSEDGSIVAMDGWGTAFDWSGSSWTQKGDELGGGPPSGLVGYSVALSSNGLTLALGAPETEVSVTNAGVAAVFQWPVPNTANVIPGPETYFSFFLPDGRECTEISPQRVQVGTFVELPGVDANCHSMPRSVVAGWTIPVPQGFTGAGSSLLPLSPGHRVRVIESQRFTAVTVDPVLTIEYDANVATSDACLTTDGMNADADARLGYSWVPRVDFAMARTWSQAPCTPTGYELAGWNTRGDGSGQSLELGESLPTDWEAGRMNTHHLYAIWRAS